MSFSSDVTEELATMSPSDLYFDIQVDYATRCIAVRGEFDLATAPCLATAIAGFQRARAGHITVDLADVTFIDAAGLGALVAAKATQHQRGDTLAVDRAPAEVRRLFMLSQLAELLHDDRPAEHDEPDRINVNLGPPDATTARS